jgi:hypothetical protein
MIDFHRIEAAMREVKEARAAVSVAAADSRAADIALRRAEERASDAERSLEGCVSVEVALLT